MDLSDTNLLGTSHYCFHDQQRSTISMIPCGSWCVGTSGAPLLEEQENKAQLLVGIFNSGPPSCNDSSAVPVTYQSISSVVNWMRETIATNWILIMAYHVREFIPWRTCQWSLASIDPSLFLICVLFAECAWFFCTVAFWELLDQVVFCL